MPAPCCWRPACHSVPPNGRPAAALTCPASAAPPAPPSLPPHQEAIEGEQLSKLREYIESLGGTLDSGWRCRANIRDFGSRAGSLDTWFTAPHGETFRSKVAVARGLGLDPGAAPKPRATRRQLDPDRPRPVRPPKPPRAEGDKGESERRGCPGPRMPAVLQTASLGLMLAAAAAAATDRLHPPWPPLPFSRAAEGSSKPAAERAPKAPAAAKVKRPRGWNAWTPSEKWQDDPVIDAGKCCHC